MTQTVLGWSAFFASVFGAPTEWLKNTLLFHPSPAVEVTPAAYGLAYEDVRFGGKNGMLLHGWHIPVQETFSLSGFTVMVETFSID